MDKHNFLSNNFIKKNKNNFFENLVVVDGPFQLLNAIEAINEFKLKKVLLIVMVNKIEKSNIQVNNNINKYISLFDHIERLSFSNKLKKYFQYFQFIYALKSNKYKYIIVGTVGKVVKLLITKIDFDRVILFDDGLETIHTAELLYSKPILIRYQYSYLGLNRQFKNEFICFSILNHKNKNIKIIKNNMSFIKDNVIQKIDENVIAFIGQDFVRNGYVKKKDYFDVLELISKKYTNYMIEYYPHRGETDLELDEINEIFSNFKIMKIDTTFEVYLAIKKYLPKKVISCWSTVLIVMKAMFENIELESILIENNKLVKNNNKILETYKYFISENIKLLNITGEEVVDVK